MLTPVVDGATDVRAQAGEGAVEKVKQPALRWYQLSRAPQVLTLHLKVAPPHPAHHWHS
jgi:hypothetical protein